MMTLPEVAFSVVPSAEWRGATSRELHWPRGRSERITGRGFRKGLRLYSPLWRARRGCYRLEADATPG